MATASRAAPPALVRRSAVHIPQVTSDGGRRRLSLQATADSLLSAGQRLPAPRHPTSDAVPRGLTAIRLVLAGTCVVTLAIAYVMTRPSAEAAREIGSAPVRVVDEPTYDAQRLGRAVKIPALAPPPAPPKPAPAPVEPTERRPSVPADPPLSGAQPPEPYVGPTPVAPPAPPTPPPAPVYEAPPLPQPPPSPSQEPEVVIFDDSG
jgi:hypothetical protein